MKTMKERWPKKMKSNIEFDFTEADEEKHICENMVCKINGKKVFIIYGEDAQAFKEFIDEVNNLLKNR